MAAAQMTERETARFLACVEVIYTREFDNPLSDILVPVICGERHVDIRPSCNFIQEIRTPQTCLNRDALNWQLNVRDASGLGPDWVAEDGSLVRQGLNRCAEMADQAEESGCIIEVYWREAMYLVAAPVMQRIASEAGQ